MSKSTQTQLADEFTEFVLHEHKDDLAEWIQDRGPDNRSLVVDWGDLYRYNSDLAQDLLDQPSQVRPAANDGLRAAIKTLPINEAIDKYGGVTLRFSGLHDADVRGTSGVRSRHIGEYLGVSGQLAKLSQTAPSLELAVFECTRCGGRTEVPQGRDEQEPHECSACERQGPFKLDVDASMWVDQQRLRVQQPPEETLGGRAASIDVVLEDDAVIPLDDGRLKPGNRVTINGRVTIERDDTPNQYIKGDHVHVEDSDYEELEITHNERNEIQRLAAGDHGDPYRLIRESLAPAHHGDELIKDALALQMFRGVRAQQPDGSWTRGDSHILLLGDPGVGKSSLLRRVADIAPRSSFASGKGLTKAATTAAAVPSDFGDEKWSVEAGVLVLSSGGVACIDEIDKVSDDAVSSLHGALESPQVVEVDKADIHTTLPAQTSLLAAGNPKQGRFDEYEPIAEQIDLDPTLLSRFDLMFMMQDTAEEERDRELAGEMIETRKSAIDNRRDDRDASDDAPPITEDLLRKYIAHARQEYAPTYDSEEVRELLVDTFVSLRSMGYDEDSPIPITPRKLEAMQRLVEASARIRLSDTVEAQDVEHVYELLTESLKQVGMNEDGEMDADVIETGNSKPQRERVRLLKACVQEEAAKREGGAPIDDVIDLMIDEGITEEDARHAIAKLKSEGELYEPESNKLRRIKG